MCCISSGAYRQQKMCSAILRAAHNLLTGRRQPPVTILKPDNVIFAKIPTSLNLDDDERTIAEIFQPVLRAGRNIG